MMIGAKLAEARKAMGLTREQLAVKLNMTAQAVSSWERGDSLPDLEKLVLLAKVLQVSPNELLAEDDSDWKLKVTDRQPLLDRAIEFTVVKHSRSLRKGTTIPYITHVMEAMEIVSHLTDDEEIRAAAVLHDTLEDTDTTKEELVRHFGPRVAELVAAESENKREDQAAEDTWGARKAETIRHLSEAGADVRMVALGDKLSNVRALHRDYLAEGEELWKRFNQKNPVMHGWYYGTLANIFSMDETIGGTQACREYVELCSGLFSGSYDRDGNPVEDDPGEGLPVRALFIDKDDDLRAGLPEGAEIHSLILDRTEDQDLQEIQKMAMALDALMRTEEVGFTDVHLVIENEPGSGDVSWKRTDDGYAVHLCAESGKNWCQTAYQLGYVMMHCLIDHLDPARKEGISWAEELVCEAAALELLYQLRLRWEETPFGTEDPDYAEYIQEYCDQCLADTGTSALFKCPDRGELEKINQRNSFDDRLDESHDLHLAMNEGDLQKLAEIRRYEADSLLLRTRSWRSSSRGSKAVDFICRLQESIPGCEIPQEADPRDSEAAEEEDAVFPGIPPAGFRQNLNEWLENPHWRKYYDTAPSALCRQLIALEFWYSETESGAAVRAMQAVEESLSLEDWQHLYRYCGDNPRKAVIHDRIMDILLKDQFDLLADIRNHPDKYYPLVDLAYRRHESETKSGDVNIGWNIGLLADNRPWFGECWARDGMTMLTYFISAKGMEDSAPEQLKHMLEEAGVIRFIDPDRDNTPTVGKFNDGNGNEFFSVNLLVGIEDEAAYITKDSGIIHSFRDLNRFNEKKADN